MITIHNIQKGQEFYIIQNNQTPIRYEYLCIMPSKNPIYETPTNYHIVINKFTENPERWYHTDLTEALNNEWAFKYEDTKQYIKEKKLKELQDLLENFDKYY